MSKETVWMAPPGGEPEEVEAAHETIVKLMVQGWRQVEPPPKDKPAGGRRKPEKE